MKFIRTPKGYQLGNLHAENLPPRQAQILLCCAQGMSEKAAAIFLNCSPKNINAAKSTLFFKLRAANTPDLITKAFLSKTLRILSLLAALNIAVNPVHINAIRLTKTRTLTRVQREQRFS